MSESGLESLTLPRRRRINSLTVIKNQLLDQLNYGLAKLLGSPLIRNKTSLADVDDLSVTTGIDTVNLGSPSESLNRTLNRFTIDPVRQEKLIDKEIEILKKEETYLNGCLADIDTLVTQINKVEEELKEKEKKELESKTEDFNNFQQSVLDKIEQLTATKEKIDEHLVITTRLRDCLKRQLKESCKRRDLLKDNLFAHVKEIEKLNRKLAKEAEQYQRDVAYMEETFKNVRLGDKTLVEDYKAKERLIEKELEERMVIRKTLEEFKLIDRRLEENELVGENTEKEEDEEEDEDENLITEEEQEEVVIAEEIEEEEEEEDKIIESEKEEVQENVEITSIGGGIEIEEVGENKIEETLKEEVEAIHESGKESDRESDKESIKD